jgi:nucleotide-binding universal stress UspA family protein
MFDKILVPLDGSKVAECSLPYVEALAKGQNVKGIILLRVCEKPNISSDYPPNMPESWEQHVGHIMKGVQQQCSLYLGGVDKKLRESGVKVTVESCLGNAAEEIVNFAEKNQVNLIVMASHGRSGVSKWAFGSVAEKVFRSTSIPVLMIKAAGQKIPDSREI